MRNFWKLFGVRIELHPEFVAERTNTYLCTECDAIGTRGDRCPRCKSSALLAVARVIRREQDQIRMVAA